MTPLAERLYNAFWAAAKTISDDNSIHPMQHPYMDQTMSMIDTPASGMPHQFWEHMATAFMRST